MSFIFHNFISKSLVTNFLVTLQSSMLKDIDYKMTNEPCQPGEKKKKEKIQFQFEVQPLNKSQAWILHIQSHTNFWLFEVLHHCLLNILPTFLVCLFFSKNRVQKNSNLTAQDNAKKKQTKKNKLKNTAFHPFPWWQTGPTPSTGICSSTFEINSMGIKEFVPCLDPYSHV